MNLRRTICTLAAIGLFDLCFSLWLFRSGLAVEGNPAMAWVLSHSPLAFVALKCLLLLGPIGLLQWAAARHPDFVLRAARVAAAAYVSALAFAIVQVAWKHQLDIHRMGQVAPMVHLADRHLPDAFYQTHPHHVPDGI